MLSTIFLLSTILSITVAKVRLSDGTSLQTGIISPDLKWQSSGLLYEGCGSSYNISNCYTLSLTSDPTKQLDPGYPTPRQRIEFRSANQADGSSFKYTWKHYLANGVGTTNRFFHLMQVFSIGDGGPVVTLDAVSGKAAIKDYARSCADTGCPSIPIGLLLGRTTSHTMFVTYGPSGKLNYVVSDARSGETLLSYNVTGTMGTGGSYVKYGTYRAAIAGMTSSSAVCGEFAIKKQ